MKILVIEFTFINKSICRLPSHKGSMLRGAFGHALKDIACHNLQAANCDSCMTRLNCMFHQMFAAEENGLIQQKDIPRPYVFRSDDAKTSFDQIGQILIAEMVVFDQLVNFVPQLVFAMQNACKNGFGSARLPFKLAKTILRGAGGSCREFESEDWERVVPTEISPPKNADSPETVRGFFEISSPLFLKDKKAGRCKLQGSAFLKSVIRRVSALSRFWGDNEWTDFPFGKLFRSLDSSRIIQENLEWKGFSRYSCSKNGEFPVEGYVGQFVIDNIPVVLLDTLSVLEDLHVGKGAAWGQGRVKAVGFF